MDKVLSAFVLATFGVGIALVFFEPIAAVAVFLGNILLLRLAKLRTGLLVRDSYIGLAIAVVGASLQLIKLLST